ncbi:MAG: FkbM family methyltransferase [Synechococcaceae bacterium WB8_1B_057]|nr:FkbM family methyltransferase [Synechococcaceae bacterium WB6_1A_059]NDG79671.1 FkbM family methyltransferase [Synechococcaceae bacterium WB8_1B_057]
MDLKELIELNDQGWYWPKEDAKGQGGAWFDLAGEFSQTPDKVAAVVSNHNVILQAGGNCGLYVKKYASLFKVVYTFEPDPVNFYCLNLNVTEHNVFKYQAALGYHRETINIANHMPNNVGAKHVQGIGPVPTIRIDDLGLKVCDCIQLDIEGFELHALHGARETLVRCRPILIVEFGWEHRYKITREDIDLFLKSIDYSLEGNLEGAQADLIYRYTGDE